MGYLYESSLCRKANNGEGGEEEGSLCVLSEAARSNGHSDLERRKNKETAKGYKCNSITCLSFKYGIESSLYLILPKVIVTD